MTILIPDTVRAVIAEHLRASYPREGCGALVGRRERAAIAIDEAVPLPNRVQAEAGRDRFDIDPLAYLQLEQRLLREGGGRSVVGFFHSHPDGPAHPSHIDLEMARGLFDVARTFYVYAIQSVYARGAGELSAWRLNTQLNGFDWVIVP